jgi:hypothetical protein
VALNGSMLASFKNTMRRPLSKPGAAMSRDGATFGDTVTEAHGTDAISVTGWRCRTSTHHDRVLGLRRKSTQISRGRRLEACSKAADLEGLMSFQARRNRGGQLNQSTFLLWPAGQFFRSSGRLAGLSRMRGIGEFSQDPQRSAT